MLSLKSNTGIRPREYSCLGMGWEEGDLLFCRRAHQRDLGKMGCEPGGRLEETYPSRGFELGESAMRSETARPLHRVVMECARGVVEGVGQRGS